MKKTIFLIMSSLFIYQNSFGQNSIYKFSGIEAHLFYNLNKDFSQKKVAGILSENIIDNKDFYLWNTTIGEGSAEGSSNQTLLIFNLTGKEDTNEERTLKVECKLEGKVILEQEIKITNYSQDPNCSYAVLVNNTGCGELEIYGEILNAKTKQVEDKISKTIDFECGE